MTAAAMAVDGVVGTPVAARRHDRYLAATMLWVIGLRVLVLGAGLATFVLRSPPVEPPLVWDEQSYHYLLEHGYPDPTDVQHQAMVAFFPFYPLMARPVAAWVPPHVALLLVSNLCALIGFVFFYLWVRNLASARVASISTLVLASSISAFFFSRALTEGPFFMFVAICLWLMQQDRLFFAAAVCGLATFTRPTGLALAVTLGLYALLQTSPRPWNARLARAALVGFIGITGLLAYEGFLWSRYERPGVYVMAQSNWEKAEDQRVEASAHAEGVPRYSMKFFVNRAATAQAWNRVFALAILLLTFVGFIRPGPVPRVLYVLPLVIFLMTVLPNHGIRISSVLRYESPALPLFVLIGWWLSKLKRPSMTGIILGVSLAVQLLYAVLFCRSIWVG